MAKLDFRTLSMPTLELDMVDKDNTHITVTTPTEELVEEMEEMRENVSTIFAADNPDAIDACYDLAARVISCNRQGIQVSIDDLKSKYWPTDKAVNQLHLLAFFKAYVDFINEIKNEKN
jgi:hypothetical protein